jgi:hypothetical protein
LIMWNLIWTIDMDSSVRCQVTILDVPGLFYEVSGDHFRCPWSIIYVMMVVKGLTLQGAPIPLLLEVMYSHCGYF